MSVYQREIVEVNFQLPDLTFKPHPIIIISNENVFATEDIFYGLMISSKIINPEFEFEITDEMVTRFDMQFERDRKEGNTDEPGDAPDAPYKPEHHFATIIEMMRSSGASSVRTVST